MSIKIIKQASKSPTTDDSNTGEIVRDMLHELEQGGEECALKYARELDNWEEEIVVSRAQIEAAGAALDPRLKLDIQFSHARVKMFAEAQLKSMQEFEIELSPGLFAGQRLLPVNTAGCYVPGGRYAHIASAIMSITTTRVAGVKHIITCSPAHKEVADGRSGRSPGIHPAILYAADLAGTDTILSLGGVQGIAALAFGLFTGHPANILTGPGNQFVAEAKRMLFGRVGIDLLAGPTEILVIADAFADAQLIATDLVSQAEHGPNSPAWLVSTSQVLADKVCQLLPDYIQRLPEPNRSAAHAAWRDYGEVVVVETDAEAVQVSDKYAPEHLEVHCKNLDWWLQNLSNYGSLFLGEETTVSYGDKCTGTNHILPTKGAAKYTGGLNVGKFIKVLTWQRMTPEANREVGAVTARISRAEGMHGHALSGDDRLAKYFPDEIFDLGKTTH